eukprot:Sspe_Gene.76743::Locus_47947_Transcript_1_1_Confidence_1.000_Length_1030::g.76743::m.76743
MRGLEWALLLILLVLSEEIVERALVHIRVLQPAAEDEMWSLLKDRLGNETFTIHSQGGCDPDPCRYYNILLQGVEGAWAEDIISALSNSSGRWEVQLLNETQQQQTATLPQNITPTAPATATSTTTLMWTTPTATVTITAILDFEMCVRPEITPETFRTNVATSAGEEDHVVLNLKDRGVTQDGCRLFVFQIPKKAGDSVWNCLEDKSGLQQCKLLVSMAVAPEKKSSGGDSDDDDMPIWALVLVAIVLVIGMAVGIYLVRRRGHARSKLTLAEQIEELENFENYRASNSGLSTGYSYHSDV